MNTSTNTAELNDSALFGYVNRKDGIVKYFSTRERMIAACEKARQEAGVKPGSHGGIFPVEG